MRPFFHYYFLVCTILPVQEIDLDRAALSPRRGVLIAHHHRPNCVIALERCLVLATPHRRSITSARLRTSLLRSVEFFARPHRAWGLRPCPAPSSDRVINAEHINQLSRFDAKKLPVFNFCSIRPSIIPFWQKVACEKLPCRNFVCDTQIQIPRLLGASFMKIFLLHMIILVRLRSLFVYYATICTILT